MKLNQKKKQVICFGTFDILHQGHLNYFQQAKEFGDHLIVVIARDKNANKELIFSEDMRLKFVKKLELVNEAVLGDLKDRFKVIKEEKPDVICLGYDHQISEEELKQKLNKFGLNPEIKRMKPFHPEKYKSSLFRGNFLSSQ